MQELKLKLVRVLRGYQKSGKGTVKWHILDSFGYYIVNNGGLYLYDACLYEYLLTVFKSSYGKTPK